MKVYPRRGPRAATLLIVLSAGAASAQDPPPLPPPAPPAAPPSPPISPAPDPNAPTNPAYPPDPNAPAATGAPAASTAAPYTTPYPAAPPPGPGLPPAQPYGAPAPGQPPPAVVEPPPPEPPWPTLPEAAYRHHRLTLQTESVFSADEGPFYNHLLGGRYAYNTTRATNLGVYVGYANLKGTGERVHSVLFLGQFEYQLFFGELEHVIVPLRVGIGYLAQNGPMVRFATGVYFVVSDDLQAGMDLIAPSYWNASNDTVLSMSLSAEVSYLF